MQKPSCAFPKASSRRLQRMFTQNKRVSASNTLILQSAQLQCKSWNLGGLYTLACERQLWERHKTNVRQAPKTWAKSLHKAKEAREWNMEENLTFCFEQTTRWRECTRNPHWRRQVRLYFTKKRNFNDFHSSWSYHIHINTYMGVRICMYVMHIHGL